MYEVNVGQRIGALVLVKLVHWQGGTGRNYAGYLCRCDCGAEVQIRSEDLRHGKQKYCSKHCEARHPRTLKEWLANTSAKGQCKEWQGPTTNGYGRIQKNGIAVYAHREVLRLATGDEPEVVMHTCDNPLCINPNHLKAGTHVANTQDMIGKRRNVRGEKVHTAKLTETDVRAIRKARSLGVQGTALAKQYGVVHSVIYAISLNQIWKDVV